MSGEDDWQSEWWITNTAVCFVLDLCYWTSRNRFSLDLQISPHVSTGFPPSRIVSSLAINRRQFANCASLSTVLFPHHPGTPEMEARSQLNAKKWLLKRKPRYADQNVSCSTLRLLFRFLFAASCLSFSIELPSLPRSSKLELLTKKCLPRSPYQEVLSDP